MSSNSSSAPVEQTPPPLAEPSSNAQPRKKMPLTWKILYALGLPIWVFVGFMLAQVLLVLAIDGLNSLGVPLAAINVTLLNTVGGALIYGLAIFIVIGVPWLIRRRGTTKKELGLQRLPEWLDLLWAPAGFIVYLVLTVAITWLGGLLFTFVDFEQTQDTGFTGLSSQLEYILAFVSLVIVAPFAEEVLFRGYLLGKLRKIVPIWLAILITSLLFAFVHGQWNVGLDVFALSIVLCLLRVYTGSLWASIVLHMLKNGIAFYFLFINPVLLSTL